MSGGSVSSWLLRGLTVELYQNTEREKAEVHLYEMIRGSRDVVQGVAGKVASTRRCSSSVARRRLFLDGRYEVPDRLLVLCADVGELDSLAFLARPHYRARDLDGHIGGGQAE